MARTQSTEWSTSYEIAALTGAGCAVLGLGAGMVAKQPGIGAVLGAGVGLMVRAAAVALGARTGR